MPASARLTMHPVRVFSAYSSKVAWSMPGTLPTVVMSTVVIEVASSILPIETTASVSTESGTWPSIASAFDSAIEKHEASAAPRSCSGFAPGASSNRVRNEKSPAMPPSPAANVPEPPFRSPFHSALPVAAMRSPSVRCLGPSRV